MISLVFSDVVIYNDRIDCKIRTEIVIHWAATETAEIEYYLFQGEAMKEITKSESKVMMVIWSSSQDLGLQEIMALLETNYDSLWKPQTVSTFLARLTKKGYLNMYRQGRQFLYRVMVEKEDYIQWMLSGMIDFWFDGKKENLIQALDQ